MVKKKKKNLSESDEEAKNRGREYEKQRQLRIDENKERIKLLGLHNIANSLMGSSLKSKRVVKNEENDDDDDDYKPNDEAFTSSSDDDSEYEIKSISISSKLKKTTPSKQISTKQPMDFTDNMDEDEALMQAITLSLKDFGGTPDSQHCKSSQGSNVKSESINKKDDDHFQEGSNVRKKKRKQFSSRVQMTADDLVIHFCQIDEAGKGSITLRDLERMAATHDFIWTDKELADMVGCFDSDRDGKLNLDDFQNIVRRCNMLQARETP